ncbi:DNA-formamidopyrimidine glycosylase family protein [Aestuariivirga sp.]|uniref:Fpg/Nei family DNA glycosylase n=1 Tax=Aestuariivirga sp. TaxID=2650926 RepID=UPI0025B7B9C6|nr:DNA-formamidopyrimidine glycosylase family protein [Aestuariivirga sp.]MCA3555861.1 Fpg/Nei family DNA glycosylase [Aestuariivirga sp.]
MPEGHTIHRAARDQRPMLVGQALDVSSPQGRFMAGAARLDGRRCTGIDAHGKHLLYRFGELSLHIHLGLFGRFRCARRPAAEPKGEVRVRMMSGTHTVDINGPNSCEVLDTGGAAALVSRIGPDVLRADADPERAWQRISRSRASIGQLIMDQSVMAGIGNIYRSEILWRQRIHPDRPGSLLPREAFDRIWADAVSLLTLGVKSNAIITVDGMKKSKSRYGERVNIFAKDACPACGGPITAFEIAGRRAFACTACQPKP